MEIQGASSVRFCTEAELVVEYNSILEQDNIWLANLPRLRDFLLEQPAIGQVQAMIIIPAFTAFYYVYKDISFRFTNT